MRFALKEGDARKASTRRFLYALRAGLRRAGGSFSFITQHLRPSVCARARPRWLDVLGYSIPPLRGWVDRAGSSLHAPWSFRFPQPSPDIVGLIYVFSQIFFGC